MTNHLNDHSLPEERRHVFDCSGRKVAVDNEGYNTRCSEGNLEDYVRANGKYARPGITQPKLLLALNIVMPIFGSGAQFVTGLSTILRQDFSGFPHGVNDVEIVFYINEPYHAHPDRVAANRLTLDILNFIFKTSERNPGRHDQERAEFLELREMLKPSSVILLEKLEAGLGELYRNVVASFMVRLSDAVAAQNLSEKSARLGFIDRLERTTVLMFIDDDIHLQNRDSLWSAYHHIQAKNGVALGNVTLTNVCSLSRSMDAVLRGLMQVFFVVKKELNICILTPRAASLKDYHHAPSVRIEKPYADQIYFAQIAAGREIIWLDVKTNIEEEDYPSNANMVKGLREYFEGAGDESALDIFKALLPQLTCGTKRCRQKEVKDLLQLLQAKDRLRIIEQCQKMLDPRE